MSVMIVFHVENWHGFPRKGNKGTSAVDSEQEEHTLEA